ncbi:MAG TPA: radical SAM protein [Clostridia bacterium]|nr:radical SAM protein [Clostridia bacterium]
MDSEEASPDVVLIIPPPEASARLEDLGEHLGSAYMAAVLRQRGHRVTIIDALAEGLSSRATLERVEAEARPLHRKSIRGIDVRGRGAVAESKKEEGDRFPFARPRLVLGISIPFSNMIRPAISIARALRALFGKEALLTMGGHIPTLAPDHIFKDCPQIDFIVSGEGEFTLLEILEKIKAGRDWRDTPGVVLSNSPRTSVPRPNRAECGLSGESGAGTFVPRPLISSLDDLPFPARDTLPAYQRRKAIPRMLGSRGCYGNCSFCSVNAFYRSAPGPRWRGRSPQSIAEEMERLSKDYGVREVMFSDDNFIGPGKMGKERAVAVAEEIMRRSIQMRFSIACRANDIDRETFTVLKKAGLKGVFLGIESGVQRALDSFNKGVTVEDNRRAALLIRELGLDLILGFIMFDPDTTLEEILENLQFLRSIGIGASTIFNRIGALNRLDAYEGTPMAERLREEGRLQGDYTGYRYRMRDPRAEFVYRTGLLAYKIHKAIKSLF